MEAVPKELHHQTTTEATTTGSSIKVGDGVLPHALRKVAWAKLEEQEGRLPAVVVVLENAEVVVDVVEEVAVEEPLLVGRSLLPTLTRRCRTTSPRIPRGRRICLMTTWMTTLRRIPRGKRKSLTQILMTTSSRGPKMIKTGDL